MAEITAFAGRTTDGDRVYVTLSVEKFDRTVQTVNHETVTGGVRLSLSGFVIGKGQRQAHSAGQCLEILKDVYDARESGWSRHDVVSARHLWRFWHLNDMRAGCAHMSLPADQSYDARKGITCSRVVVKRDGETVSPVLASEDDAFTWLLRHQGMSVDWALTHEGYSIEPAYTYGRAWLYEEPPAEIIAEAERLMALPLGKVPSTY